MLRTFSFLTVLLFTSMAWAAEIVQPAMQPATPAAMVAPAPAAMAPAPVAAMQPVPAMAPAPVVAMQPVVAPPAPVKAATPVSDQGTYTDPDATPIAAVTPVTTMSATPVVLVAKPTGIGAAAIIGMVGGGLLLILSVLSFLGYLKWTQSARAQMILAAVQTGIAAFATYAKSTPTQWDDALADLLTKINDALLKGGGAELSPVEKTQVTAMVTLLKNAVTAKPETK